ncbi:hypothetical protein ACFO4P_17100 [Epilithonimonas pallida]|uniref:Uncharacterized protein n=1 Tax=Epilithonimonas pallida TaxID=373671 RepID=A0ABY1R6H3_9FLAO|nr:hypothetical protein [Epilithonimonas pallida]SMP94706.1 hypothetical protein SAMN05421679_106105 [Epilithonimonas pallida]
MRNKTDQTTQVNDYGSFNIYQFAEAFMPKKKEKLPTPCEFLRKNLLKHYRYRFAKDGNVILSVCTHDGKNIHSKERNFSMAYIKLVRDPRFN